MDSTGLRRSTRTRTQVQLYNCSERPHIDEAHPIEQIIAVEISVHKHERIITSETLVDKHEHDTVSVKREASLGDVFDDVSQLPLQKRIKVPSGKMRKSTKKPTEQLYDRPAEGTIIPWGISRTRKQPKIYPVDTTRRRVSTFSHMSMDYVFDPDENYSKPDDSWMMSAAVKKINKQRSTIKRLIPGAEETRLKPFRNEPPEWYHRALNRANTEKMFVLERTRTFEENCHANHDDCPCETIEFAGSKGNVYTVSISHLPSCTCPATVYAKKGQDVYCKHIVYVLHHVLKTAGSLGYQAAFLTSELKQVFADAPPLPVDVTEESVKDGNRKPIEGDCPICFTEFEGDGQGVVWCKAACGNNIHQDCFNQWAKTKPKVTCPFCRSEWQFNDQPKTDRVKLTNVDMTIGAGGYKNVYDQLDYAANEN